MSERRSQNSNAFTRYQIRLKEGMMGKISLGKLEKMNSFEDITVELQRSLKVKRKFLTAKIKLIDSILSKPLKKK